MEKPCPSGNQQELNRIIYRQKRGSHSLVRKSSPNAAVCIVNARAGSNRAARQRAELKKLFEEKGRDVRIVLARDGNAILRHAKEAAKNKSELVIAAGGDGTVSAVACHLIGTETTLGVLPMGTLNHFAKDLKIPQTLPEAVAVLFDGTPVQADVGEVNGQVFLNNSSIGFYPGVVQVRDALQRKGHGKWTAFARALLRVFRRASPLSVRLKADEIGEKATTTPFVFVGNNRYELTAPHAGERPSLSEGKLWVYEAPHAGRSKLIGLAIRSLLGRQTPAELAIFDTAEFWIRTRSTRIRVANDGEVLNLTPPLHYRSIPGGLRVMVPAAPRTDDALQK